MMDARPRHGEMIFRSRSAAKPLSFGERSVLLPNGVAVLLEDDEQVVVDHIATYGWHSVHVRADGDGPDFCYSIGLDELIRIPELIIFGLEHDVMHSMSWEIVRQIQAGRLLASDMIFNDLLDDRPCIVKPVHPSWLVDYLGYACWYYHYRQKLDRLQAFQVFWPGARDGLFPWQAGCAEDVIAAQPLLYMEQSDA
jgi:hypothetical protein